MEGEVLQKVQDRIAELPEDIQEAILSSEFEKTIQQIGSKHGLHIDQMGALGDETMLVMLGFTKADDFAKNVASATHVPIGDAEKLMEEVGSEVFLPIRESMKAFAEKQKQVAEETEEVPGEAATTPAPATIAATPPTPVPPKPSAGESLPMKPELHAAEVMLRQTTVSVPPAQPPVAPKPTPAEADANKNTPPAPAPYKTDPYREPPTP